MKRESRWFWVRYIWFGRWRGGKSRMITFFFSVDSSRATVRVPARNGGGFFFYGFFSYIFRRWYFFGYDRNVMVFWSLITGRAFYMEQQVKWSRIRLLTRWYFFLMYRTESSINIDDQSKLSRDTIECRRKIVLKKKNINLMKITVLLSLNQCKLLRANFFRVFIVWSAY